MFDIVAYKERESEDPATGAEGILRTEWRIIPLVTWEKTHDPYAAFGPNWTTYKPRAKFVMEQRYIRRGVDEGWKPFDLYDSREDALSSIDSDAMSASSGFTKVEEARIAAARTAKIQEARKREADAAAATKRAKQQRSQDAFGRLSEGKGKALTDAYNAFVTSHMNDASVRAQILADRSLYDAIMDAETVPAKSKAIKAFLKRYASAGGKRRKSKSANTAVVEYRRLVAMQQKMPDSAQWTMGERVRRAKARAYAEMEYDATGIRGGGKRRHTVAKPRTSRLSALVSEINRLTR